MIEPGPPRFKHDCPVVGAEAWSGAGADRVTMLDEEACTFIGRWTTGALATYDLYIHVRKRPAGTAHVETVARFGDDGPEYLSGPSVARMIQAFVADDA